MQALSKNNKLNKSCKTKTQTEENTVAGNDINYNETEQHAGSSVLITPRPPLDPPPSKQIQESSFSAARFRRFQKPVFKRTPKSAISNTVTNTASENKSFFQSPNNDSSHLASSLKSAGALKTRGFFNETLFTDEINQTLQIAQKRGTERNMTHYGTSATLTSQTRAKPKNKKPKNKKRKSSHYNELLHAARPSVMMSLRDSSNSVAVRIV